MPKPAVEDLFMKRELLNRYRTSWERELNQAALTPKQRAKIVEDIRLLGAIDEDLLRLERQLQGQRLGAPSLLPEDRADNDGLRKQIMELLHNAGAMVPTEVLCSELGIDKTHLRNVMRSLLNSQRAASLGDGYRALTVPVKQDAESAKNTGAHQ